MIVWQAVDVKERSLVRLRNLNSTLPLRAGIERVEELRGSYAEMGVPANSELVGMEANAREA